MPAASAQPWETSIGESLEAAMQAQRDGVRQQRLAAEREPLKSHLSTLRRWFERSAAAFGS
jgi:hypothetical protein